MTEKILANQAQNVYAGVKGGSAASRSMAVDVKELQQKSGEKAVLRKKKEISKNTEKAKEARNIAKDVAIEQVKWRQRPKSERERLQDRPLASLSERAAAFVRNLPPDPSLHRVVNEFDQVLRALEEKREEIPTATLIRHYLTIYSIAKDVEGFSKDSLSGFQQELRQRDIDPDTLIKVYSIEEHWREEEVKGKVTKEQAEQAIKDEIEPEPESGGSPIPPETLRDFNPNDFADPTLRNIAEQIRSQADAGQADEEFFRRLTERVEGLQDKGQVDQTEARRIVQNLDGWRIQAQTLTREGERGEETRAERRAAQPEPLRPEDMEGREALDLGRYQNADAQAIVREIQSRVLQGHADNEYLKTKINELAEISRTFDGRALTAQEQIKEEEIDRIFNEVATLKDLLAARFRQKRSARTSDYSMYGEIRLLLEEKKELVDYALQTSEILEPDPVKRRWAKRSIEKWFNELFARADARAGSDWRDAMAQSGAIEVDDFSQALTAVASGRITLANGQLATREQRDALNRVIRDIDAESKLREYLHSLTYYVNQAANSEQIRKVVTGFKAEGADRVFRTTGVSAASHFFEQAMLQVMARHGGWLPYEAMVNKIDGTLGEVEALVLQNMRDAVRMGILPKNIEEWEIGRAISLARGMGIVTGRFFEVVAASGIPKGQPLVSWWANKIVNKIAFFRQIARYDVGREQNAILLYKLEGRSPAWSLSELEEIKRAGMAQIFDRFVNDFDEKDRPIDDRYIDMLNPFRIGSLYTQTGWRWKDDKVNHAGAVAHILDGDPDSPIIGLGLWIEKLRGELASDNEGVRSVADRRLRMQVEHALQITPLKFFYNLNGLRQDVLRSGAIRELYGADAVYEDQERDEKTDKFKYRGQILIKSEELEQDLRALTLVQERLLTKRVGAYRTYLERRDAGDRTAVRPDLFSAEMTQFDFEDIAPAQRQRIERLASLIRTQFRQQNHYERFVHNLHDKSWKIPFVFGTDDIPHEIFNYGGTGDEAFERRWGDIDSAAKAASAYESLIRNMAKFESTGDIKKALAEIYNALVGHDEGVTRELMERTIEGIIKFYKKDVFSRLPLGMGWLSGFLGGHTSYAQLMLGREQMAWDEMDIDRFLKECHAAAFITEEQVKKLRKRTGAEMWNLTLAISRSFVGLLILSFIYYMFQKTSGDVAK